MSLTVPKAGVIAGRSAAPQFEAPTFGASLAALGDVGQQIGQKLEHERLGRELQRVRLNVVDGLTGLRDEFDQLGDPDAIDSQWAPRAAKLREDLTGGLDARIREDARLAFDDLQMGHTRALGQRAMALRNQQAAAYQSQMIDTTVRAAALADPETQAAVLGQFEDSLLADIASGRMSEDAAARARVGVQKQMEELRAIDLLENDPAALLAAIEGGEYWANDPKAIVTWRARAQAAVKTEETRAQTEAARAEAERLRNAATVLSDATAVVQTGLPLANQGVVDAMLADPTIAATPQAREYAFAATLAEELPGFAVTPTAAKREALAEAEARPIEQVYEADLVEAMRTSIAADEKAFRENPYAAAAARGIAPPPELPDPTSATVEELVPALRARAAWAGSLEDAGWADRIGLFDTREHDGVSEKSTWKALIDSSANPTVQVRVAQALSLALGPEAEAAAEALGGGELFSFMAGHIAATGNAQLAREVFEGQRAIDNKDVKMPTEQDRRGTFFETLGALFFDGTGPNGLDESAVRNQAIAAADALYAYRTRGTSRLMVELTSLQETKYLQALHEVLGGTGTYDKSSAQGGIQKVAGSLTLLPLGVSGAAVTGALSVYTDVQTNDWLAKRMWTKVSVTGNVPDVAGELPDAATWSRMRLHPVGGTSYEMIWTDIETGQLLAIVGDDGAPFLLDLDKLLVGVK